MGFFFDFSHLLYCCKVICYAVFSTEAYVYCNYWVDCCYITNDEEPRLFSLKKNMLNLCNFIVVVDGPQPSISLQYSRRFQFLNTMSMISVKFELFHTSLTLRYENWECFDNNLLKRFEVERSIVSPTSSSSAKVKWLASRFSIPVWNWLKLTEMSYPMNEMKSDDFLHCYIWIFLTKFIYNTLIRIICKTLFNNKILRCWGKGSFTQKWTLEQYR